MVNAFATNQKDDDTARTAALDSCQRKQDALNPGIRCEIYALGNTVVYARGRLPMPPEPWLIRDPSIETPFAASEVPLVGENIRANLDRAYRAGGSPKALALSPRGNQGFVTGQTSTEEAVRRSLEICASRAGIACMIIAVDDVFVVAIPMTMKVVGFFRPAGLAAIAADARERVVRRLRNGTRGWTAIAIGVGGHPGLMFKAAKEQEAIDGALANCNRQDRGCHVVAIGPFAVEPK